MSGSSSPSIIQLDQVTIEYPVFTGKSLSLQLKLYEKLGGQLKEHDKTVFVRALENVSLDVKSGQRIGLIGHNGSGKTTMLRVISGVLQPTHGTVKINGSMSSYTDLYLGMDTDASGWDNIRFRCVFLGMTFKQAAELAPSIAEFSGLGNYLDMPVRTYSTGMFVRLAFAISTAVQPDILVMDEMIGAGDAEFINKAKQRIDNLMQGSKGLVIASHDNSIIERLCTHAMWLEKGRVRAYGPPSEVIAEYAQHVAAQN